MMQHTEPKRFARRILYLLLSAVFLLTNLPSQFDVHADEPVPRNPQLRWWRGNIHTHTLWSDGNDFPEMVAEWYRTHDYNFLALSDHNVLSQGMRWMKHTDIIARGGKDVVNKYVDRYGLHWVETRSLETSGEKAGDYEVRLKPLNEFRALVEQSAQFIMIQGEEISDSVAGAPVHMNVTNVQEVISPLGGDSVAAAIEANLRAVEDQARRTGREMIVHLNHPNFGYAITAEDLARVVSERFFEVYNGHPGVNQLGDDEHPSVERIWDIANTMRIALLNGAPLMGLATDDSHNYHGKPGSTPGRGWIMVRARHLTPESIIRAMKQGEFYPSSGVRLNDLRFDHDQAELILEIDSEPDVTYTTNFIGTRRDAVVSKPVEEPDNAGEGEADGTGQAPPTIDAARVGVVLATVTGDHPTYRLQGDELYVRAIVTSSKPHPNPSFDDQFEQAWSHPVGWRDTKTGKVKRIDVR